MATTTKIAAAAASERESISARVAVMNDPLWAALADVLDPELGISIVDLGLIYRAERTTDAIIVEIGVRPTCPATKLLVEQTRLVLGRHFPNIHTIAVSIQTNKPWSPDRLTENGLRQFFLQEDDSAETEDTCGSLDTSDRRH